MKYLMFLLLSSLLFFPACENETAAPSEEGIPFGADLLNFDNAFISRDRSLPDGTFRTNVILLEEPATLDLINGITGLPSDAFSFNINSGVTPLDFPDGTYTLGDPNLPFNYSGTFLKNELTNSYGGVFFDVRSGTITVRTNDDGTKLLAFDIKAVPFLEFFNPDALVLSLQGETTVNVVIV